MKRLIYAQNEKEKNTLDAVTDIELIRAILTVFHFNNEIYKIISNLDLSVDQVIEKIQESPLDNFSKQVLDELNIDVDESNAQVIIKYTEDCIDYDWIRNLFCDEIEKIRQKLIDDFLSEAGPLSEDEINQLLANPSKIDPTKDDSSKTDSLKTDLEGKDKKSKSSKSKTKTDPSKADPKEKNDENVLRIKTIPELKTYLKDKRNLTIESLFTEVIKNSSFPLVTFTERDKNIMFNALKQKFLELHPDGKIEKEDLLIYLKKVTPSMERMYFSQTKPPVIREFITNVYNNDEKVKLTQTVAKQLVAYIPEAFNEKFSKELLDLANSPDHLKALGITIRYKARTKYTLNQMKNLPTLSGLGRVLDGIGSEQDISLANFYQVTIVLSSDGNRQDFAPGRSEAYLNELNQKNIRWALGTIVDNIVCITTKHGLSDDEIKSFKDSQSDIKKIYNMEDSNRNSFYAQITRIARLKKR